MKILCFPPLATEDQIRLRHLVQNNEIIFTSTDAVTPEQLREAEIIWGIPSPQMLSQAQNLRWLQTTSDGIDKFLFHADLPDHVLLTNAHDVYNVVLTEHTLAVLLSLIKYLPQYRDHQNMSQWKDEFATGSIAGSTTLIIGFGSIGQSIGKQLHHLGSKVLGIRNTSHTVPDFADGVFTPDLLPQVLPQADHVILLLPLTKDTYHFFDQSMFDAMKEGATFINIGRGKTVDETALIQALSAGKLGGAGLDVFENEPLNNDSPLWRFKNVLITPHVAGRSYMPDVYRKNLSLFRENLQRYLSGAPLLNRIDRTKGYNDNH